MSTIEIPAEVRATWGDGPWQTEPTRVEWRHAGLPCLIVRADYGHLCGYVAVAPGHPLFGKAPDDIGDELQGPHGGVTAAHGRSDLVFQVSEPGEFWWIGFDCMHGADYVPSLGHLIREAMETSPWIRSTLNALSVMESGKTYRDIAYVTAQVNRLAEQLGALP